MARRHTYRREEQRFGSVHCRTNSSSIDAVVHRACCSASPSYATRAAMVGTPSPGAPEKRVLSMYLSGRMASIRRDSWIGTRRVATCTFPHPLRLEPDLRL